MVEYVEGINGFLCISHCHTKIDPSTLTLDVMSIADNELIRNIIIIIHTMFGMIIAIAVALIHQDLFFVIFNASKSKLLNL